MPSSDAYFRKGHKTNLGKKFRNRKRPPPHTEETKRKIGLNGFHYGMKGKIHSEETKRKMSLARKGKGSKELCIFWKGGVSPLNRVLRTSFEYRQWRSDVFTRDNFTCQDCGSKNGNGKSVHLEAHHIKEFNEIIVENNIKTFDEAKFCEELWNINNGKTLCVQCHNSISRLRWKNYYLSHGANGKINGVFRIYKDEMDKQGVVVKEAEPAKIEEPIEVEKP